MIFKAKPIDDEVIRAAYEEGMKVLNEFWGISWVENTPDVFVLDSRKDIDRIRGKKTESWVVAWASQYVKRIFVLDRNIIGQESSWKYTPETYTALIKHELGHLFFRSVSKGRCIPLWLNEGCSGYLSGQTLLKKKPVKFEKFLESYSETKEGLYTESGFVVELLVNKFGKEKLIHLVRSLADIDGEDKFKKAFAEIYGFELNYEKVNELYT